MFPRNLDDHLLEAVRRGEPHPNYSIREIADVRGLEVCSAFKNAYAIAIGLCDGLVKAGRWEATTNAKAALFAQAIGEMEILVRSVRGDVATVCGLPAVGDLFVTGVAGRNRTFLGRVVFSNRAKRRGS